MQIHCISIYLLFNNLLFLGFILKIIHNLLNVRLVPTMKYREHLSLEVEGFLYDSPYRRFKLLVRGTNFERIATWGYVVSSVLKHPKECCQLQFLYLVSSYQIRHFLL